MTVGPLRRIVAALGLLALVPITWQLATGGLDAEQAALRAVIVVAVVFLLGKVLRLIVTRLLHRVERRGSDRAEDGELADEVTASGTEPRQ